jgi:hypothetical protein
VSVVGNVRDIKLILHLPLSTASQCFSLCRIITLPSRVATDKFVQFTVDFLYFGHVNGGRDYVLYQQQMYKSAATETIEFVWLKRLFMMYKLSRVWPVCFSRILIHTPRANGVCFSTTRRPPYNGMEKCGATISPFGARLPCGACRCPLVDLHRNFARGRPHLQRDNMLHHRIWGGSNTSCVARNPPSTECSPAVLTRHTSRACWARSSSDCRDVNVKHQAAGWTKGTPNGTSTIIGRGHPLPRPTSDATSGEQVILLLDYHHGIVHCCSTPAFTPCTTILLSSYIPALYHPTKTIGSPVWAKNVSPPITPPERTEHSAAGGTEQNLGGENVTFVT